MTLFEVFIVYQVLVNVAFVESTYVTFFNEDNSLINYTSYNIIINLFLD